MNSNMVKPEKLDHLHLVYHFTVPLKKVIKYSKIYIHGEKSMKVPFIIYVDLDSLLEKMNTCHSNPKKSSTTKINKHIPSGYWLFIVYTLFI